MPTSFNLCLITIDPRRTCPQIDTTIFIICNGYNGNMDGACNHIHFAQFCTTAYVQGFRQSRKQNTPAPLINPPPLSQDSYCKSNEDILAVCSIFGIIGFRLIFKVNFDNNGLLAKQKWVQNQPCLRLIVVEGVRLMKEDIRCKMGAKRKIQWYSLGTPKSIKCCSFGSFLALEFLYRIEIGE